MKQPKTKNFKSQNDDEVSLNYGLVITQRHMMILPSFLGNVTVMCQFSLKSILIFIPIQKNK